MDPNRMTKGGWCDGVVDGVGCSNVVGSRWQPFRISAVGRWKRWDGYASASSSLNEGNCRGRDRCILREGHSLLQLHAPVPAVSPRAFGKAVHVGAATSSGRGSAAGKAHPPYTRVPLSGPVFHDSEGPTAGARNRGGRGSCRTMGGGRSQRVAQAWHGGVHPDIWRPQVGFEVFARRRDGSTGGIGGVGGSHRRSLRQSAFMRAVLGQGLLGEVAAGRQEQLH